MAARNRQDSMTKTRMPQIVSQRLAFKHEKSISALSSAAFRSKAVVLLLLVRSTC